MNNAQFFGYLLLMAGSTYLIRALPFATMRKKITNPFVRSFLYYIPFTVLAAMTIPAALYATGNVVAAAAGLLVATVFAVRGRSLTTVAILACLTAFVTEQICRLF